MAVQQWLADCFRHTAFSVAPITGDASARSYYRVHCKQQSFIVLVDPKNETTPSFLTIRALLYNIGLSVPQLFVQNNEQGFLLLSDLGKQQYDNALSNPHRAHTLYCQAFYPLIWMQQTLLPSNTRVTLKTFSPDFMHQQLIFFKTWYLMQHLHYNASNEVFEVLAPLFDRLVQEIAKQPLVFSHMDYHCRNLMVLRQQAMPGILDFQDAMWAPYTLDLVSLLKDCYIDWPRQQVIQWVRAFYDMKKQSNPETMMVDFQTFFKGFDWMGVQRHLRILGTFARLHHLYGKSSYLQYIPRILGYLLEMCELYPELKPLQNYLH